MCSTPWIVQLCVAIALASASTTQRHESRDRLRSADLLLRQGCGEGDVRPVLEDSEAGLGSRSGYARYRHVDDKQQGVVDRCGHRNDR